MSHQSATESHRARAFRRAYAVAITVSVWSAAALAAFLQRKQLPLFRRSGNGSRVYVSQNERWSAVYPTAEDFAGDPADVGVEGQAGPPL